MCISDLGKVELWPQIRYSNSFSQLKESAIWSQIEDKVCLTNVHILFISKNVKFSDWAGRMLNWALISVLVNPTRRKRRSQSSRTHASPSCSTSGEECGLCPWTDNASYRTRSTDSMRYRMLLGLVYMYRQRRRFSSHFKNGFNAALWCCRHITLKRSKVPFTKTATLTVHSVDKGETADV